MDEQSAMSMDEQRPERDKQGQAAAEREKCTSRSLASGLVFRKPLVRDRLSGCVSRSFESSLLFAFLASCTFANSLSFTLSRPLVREPARLRAASFDLCKPLVRERLLFIRKA
eukprot:1744254-Pleurochrysis_carterae.AAC.2